jgi:hypothetical protein
MLSQNILNADIGIRYTMPLLGLCRLFRRERSFYMGSQMLWYGYPVNKKLFADLVESMTQMKEIARGERSPSRESHES